MYKKKHINKDKKRRKLVEKYEIKRLHYKYIINNLQIPEKIRIQAQLELSKLPKDSSKVRVKNRCIITGRAKSTYKFFKLSRIMLRELGLNGQLPGLKKSSW